MDPDYQTWFKRDNTFFSILHSSFLRLQLVTFLPFHNSRFPCSCLALPIFSIFYWSQPEGQFTPEHGHNALHLRSVTGVSAMVNTFQTSKHRSQTTIAHGTEVPCDPVALCFVKQCTHHFFCGPVQFQAIQMNRMIQHCKRIAWCVIHVGILP